LHSSSVPPSVSPTTSTPSGSPIVSRNIPIDTSRWYQLNSGTPGIEGLFDGVLNVYVNTGFGKIFNVYNMYYPLLSTESMNIISVKMYDWQGVCSSSPFYLYAVYADGQMVLVAEFHGTFFDRFVGPYPDR
jgi:hypothetical protein